jgi:hypothetical protein
MFFIIEIKRKRITLLNMFLVEFEYTIYITLNANKSRYRHIIRYTESGPIIKGYIT